MSDLSTWRRLGAWDGVASPGRLGVAGPAGVTIGLCHDVALAYVIAGETNLARAAEIFSQQFGIELPATPKAAGRGHLTLVWSGPAQWLALSTETGLSRRLSAALGDHAAITDQTDARALLTLDGEHARDVLAKGCPLDLHPRSFRRGDAALTVIAGIGAQIWQSADADTFRIAVARSMAGSFWSWLTHAAAEFGVEVRQIAEGQSRAESA